VAESRRKRIAARARLSSKKDNRMHKGWQLVAMSVGALWLAGYTLHPAEVLDRDARQAGVFTTDARQVLSATVQSLKAEDRLLVYSYRGSVEVNAEHTVLWLFGGHQELSVPANVGYFVDLSGLDPNSFRYDERTQVVTVTLPPLVMGDVAFQPEQARSTNGGVLTWSQSQVDALTQSNYANARRAFTAQAQSPTIAAAARREAADAVSKLFELPLRGAGQPNVRVVATFATP